MKAMDNIIIRKGRTENAQDFSQLILLSAATFFPSRRGNEGIIMGSGLHI